MLPQSSKGDKVLIQNTSRHFVLVVSRLLKHSNDLLSDVHDTKSREKNKMGEVIPNRVMIQYDDKKVNTFFWWININ